MKAVQQKETFYLFTNNMRTYGRNSGTKAIDTEIVHFTLRLASATEKTAAPIKAAGGKAWLVASVGPAAAGIPAFQAQVKTYLESFGLAGVRTKWRTEGKYKNACNQLHAQFTHIDGATADSVDWRNLRHTNIQGVGVTFFKMDPKVMQSAAIKQGCWHKKSTECFCPAAKKMSKPRPMPQVGIDDAELEAMREYMSAVQAATGAHSDTPQACPQNKTQTITTRPLTTLKLTLGLCLECMRTPLPAEDAMACSTKGHGLCLINSPHPPYWMRCL